MSRRIRLMQKHSRQKRQTFDATNAKGHKGRVQKLWATSTLLEDDAERKAFAKPK